MIRRRLLPIGLTTLGLAVLAAPLGGAPTRPGGAGVAAGAAIATAPAAAHELGQSYLFLRIYEDSVIARVEITVADVERALGFGWDPERVTVDQVRARLDSIRSYVEARFSLASGGNRIPTAFAAVDVRYLEIADYVVLTYEVAGLQEIPDEVEVLFAVLFDANRDHRNLLVIEHNWKTGTFDNESNVSLIFSPRRPLQTLDLTSGSVLRGFLNLVWLGVWHIWIGIDHILFLMALILPSVLVREGGEWKPVPSFRQALINLVMIVSFFTIAHSVTLSVAALDVLRFPSRLVESLIAASIAVAAWANLVPRLDVREWSIAFFFGLFHGFGFATVLGDVGLGRDYLVLSLLGFNVGVELGQVAVVGAVFPVLFLLRKTPVYLRILRFGSWFLIAVALLWMFERIFDFNVPLIPIATAPLTWLRGLLTGS